MGEEEERLRRLLADELAALRAELVLLGQRIDAQEIGQERLFRRLTGLEGDARAGLEGLQSAIDRLEGRLARGDGPDGSSG